MATKSYKEISKMSNWVTDIPIGEKPTWADIKKGLLIRQTEAMEKMAENYQHLLDEVERYKRGYQDMKNRKENLEQDLIQQKRLASRYRNQRDKLKAEMEEKTATL